MIVYSCSSHIISLLLCDATVRIRATSNSFIISLVAVFVKRGVVSFLRYILVRTMCIYFLNNSTVTSLTPSVTYTRVKDIRIQILWLILDWFDSIDSFIRLKSNQNEQSNIKATKHDCGIDKLWEMDMHPNNAQANCAGLYGSLRFFKIDDEIRQIRQL